MHLILNISIIKTVSLETYYVIFLLIKECFWKHLNKNNEIKYRGHLFFIYFATKINLNFTQKKKYVVFTSQRQCTMIDLCWNKCQEREPLATVQGFTSLSDSLLLSVVILQHDPHVYLPNFCTMTQRHCWLGLF